MIARAAVLLALVASSAGAQPVNGLDAALAELTAKGQFSGAVVVRGPRGVRFAKGYGPADPFDGRRFTPDTLVDSGSLAKPVTAAAVLLLARDGRIDLDAPAQRYLPQMPYRQITIRQLLSHSAGMQMDESEESVTGKSNLQLVEAARSRPLLFAPGTAFNYCNLCTMALAEIVERVSGQHYLAFALARLSLPSSVTLRPARLADWSGRAIGYRRSPDGKVARADSYEGEIFYGAANLSISAAQLAEWGSRWWAPPLAAIRQAATHPALIGGHASGLTLGNWYCARGGRQCHYLGHHEGFHHMLYWDGDRRLSIAMVTNNSFAPALQQRLQRALVAFAEGRGAAAKRELASPLPAADVATGEYELTSGERVKIGRDGSRTWIERRAIRYPAYSIGSGVRYVPGLDAYLGARTGRGMRFLTLYEDHSGKPKSGTSVTGTK